MKESFKKYDLFKIVGIAILFVALLTWIIPISQYTGNEMYVGEISRLGIANLFASGIYSLSTVLYQVTFLLVLGGFYSILSSTSGYRKLIEKIVKKLKGKEIPFVIITSFVFAGIASITSEIYQLLIFVPFFITIISNLKMDKITALCTTFGSILIGRLGATYSPYAYNYINSYFAIGFNTEIVTKIAIFVLAFVLFNFFNIIHTKETLNKKNVKNIEDKFAVTIEEKKSKAHKDDINVWPLVITLIFVFIFQILGFIAWNTSFKITVFDKFHEWLIGLKIGGHAIFSYILGIEDIGVVKALGYWDLFNISIILIIASLVIALIYKIGFDQLIEKFLEGAKKMSRLVLLLILIYAIFIITVWNPFIPTIVNWIMGLTKHFNIFLATLSSLIASTLSVDMDYIVYSLGTFFVNIAGNHSNLMAIIINSMHGFVGFFAPTSAILMLGLAYLNIPYKDWMKYIWRFLLGLLIGLLIIFTIIRYL